MPRFYFRLTDGHRSTENRDGLDLLTNMVLDVKRHRFVRDLLQEADETGHDWHGWEVQALDADQRLVCVIPFDSS